MSDSKAALVFSSPLQRFGLEIPEFKKNLGNHYNYHQSQFKANPAGREMFHAARETKNGTLQLISVDFASEDSPPYLVPIPPPSDPPKLPPKGAIVLPVREMSVTSLNLMFVQCLSVCLCVCPSVCCRDLTQKWTIFGSLKTVPSLVKGR